MKYTILKDNKKSLRVEVIYNGMRIEVIISKEWLKQKEMSLEKAILDHVRYKIMFSGSYNVIGKDLKDTSNW